MKRYSRNPIIDRTMIVSEDRRISDVSSVFNPGAIKFGSTYLLLLRVQNRGRETFLVKATSSDGLTFTVDSSVIELQGFEAEPRKVYHIYDPRITKIGDTYHIMFAMDTDEGCVLGMADTTDFEGYRYRGIVSEKEIRNGVLFPEKISGQYVRLERPNTTELDGGVRSGGTICLAVSDDLIDWRQAATVMQGRPHYWDELIGSGPPPIKTAEGWLHIYHGVATHFGSSNIYQAGVVLLDQNDPSQVIARSRYNILEPREIYETVGQVPNVVFPSGMIVDDLDADGMARPESRVLVYYGAADTVIGVATTTISELIQNCYNGDGI